MKLFKKRKREIAFQNPQENCWMREKILLVFLKKELFCIKVMYLKQKKNNQQKNQKKNQKKKIEKIKDDYKKFMEYIDNESKGINKDFFKDYFYLVVPSALVKKIISDKK